MKLIPMLTVLFVGLKLTEYIDWSWWWVLAPVWGTIAVASAVWAFLLALKLWLEN